MNWTELDVRFMSRAIELAEYGRFTSQPNPRVGCVFSKDDENIAEGWHKKTGESHAEVVAIQSAKSSLNGACCYVTLEPCNHTGKTPPCTESLITSGVSRVIVAMQDPNPLVAGKGIKKLEQAGIQVDVGLLAEQARNLNRGFVSRMEHKRPYVICKLAISLDGKVALASGESKWITGEQARADVQRLRASSSAIMTGINTVLADDPRLNVRDVETEGRQPLRVVMDRDFRLPLSSAMLQLPGKTVVMGQTNNLKSILALEDAGAAVELIDTSKESFIANCLHVLAEKYQVNEMLVEAGPTLSGALLQAGMIDELIMYQSPTLLGHSAIDMLNLEELTSMKNRINLELLDEAMFAGDRKLVFKVNQV